MIGICGDNCAYCPRYIATQSGEKGEMEKVLELWERLGLRDRDFSAQEMSCPGCSPESQCAYTELSDCVQAKALENCGLCDEYPCKIIMSAFEKTEKLRAVAAAVCTREEMDLLEKAFFSKKDYFDRIHRKRRNLR